MRLIDLSQPLFHDCPNCPAHPRVSSTIVANHEEHGWQVESLSLVNHTGSHVDAPLHKIPGGASLDEVPLELWVGPAVIADLRDSAADRVIDGALLESRLPSDLAGRIVLLATGWGDRRERCDEWLYHSPRVNPDGARWLVAKGIRGVGIDHYSVGGCDESQNSETHAILLGNQIWIVEELRFPDEVFSLPQPVEFWSLPINLKAHSGGFCRPVIAVR